MSKETDDRITGVAILQPNGTIHALNAPSRHHDVIREIVQSGIVKTVPGTWVQGFVTGTGKFLNRWQAARAAFRAGQVKKIKDELFSEDVW